MQQKIWIKKISTKYGLAPKYIEKRSLDPNDGKYFQEVYDSVRLRKVQNNQMRNQKYDQKIDRRNKKFRSPLNLTEKVLVLAERLKKKMPQEGYTRALLKICFFSIEIES